ncbi:MAG: IS110 family transposase [Novosphingobium sp.]|nr:IS110 family transposase [Novosphingobium sp.]
MEMQEIWVGLDCGYLHTAACAIDKDGVIIAQEKCETTTDSVTAFLEMFPRQSIRLIVVEAGVATHMVRDLIAADFPIKLYEVYKAQRFLAVRRQKTDTNDAIGLAELGRVGRSIGTTVHLKSLECQNMRTRLAARQSLVRNRIRMQAMVITIVRMHGGKLKRRSAKGALSQDVEAQLDVLRRDGVDVDADVRPLVEIAEAMDQQVRLIDKRFAELARTHPVCRRLMTVPGVGPKTALTFYSAIDDVTRFKDARSVGPYFGLTPSVYQSGVKSRQGGISKMGCVATRTHLVSAATVLLVAVKKPSALKAWGDELRARIGISKARVALARKLAIVLIKVWQSETDFDPRLDSASP